MKPTDRTNYFSFPNPETGTDNHKQSKLLSVLITLKTRFSNLYKKICVNKNITNPKQYLI